MPKKITITDVIIKEVQVALVDGEYVMNVLYAQTDDTGKEYNQQWSDPIKGTDLPNGIETFLENIFTKLGDKMRLFEGV